jgi:general secretion pathway protein C
MFTTASLTPAAHPGDNGSASSSRWWPVLAAGLFWLVAGLSAGYWVLQAWGRTPVVPVAGAALLGSEPQTALVARALGVQGPGVATPEALSAPVSRYSLLGVVAGAGTSRQGAALIAVDDQPARPYRVGATLEGGLVLQSVGRASVRLGPSVSGPATLELAVPALTATNRPS